MTKSTPHSNLEPPAAAQPDEDDYDSAAFKDWTPEFTVWLVRRGKRFPMVVDSVFVREELAEKRAALLGKDEGWHAMKYSHIQPSAVEKPTGIIRRMDTPENREFWAFVERVAEEVRRERPSWAIEMTEKSQAVAPAAALSPKKLQRYDLQIAADQGRVFIEELKDDDGKWVKAADLESAALSPSEESKK